MDEDGALLQREDGVGWPQCTAHGPTDKSDPEAARGGGEDIKA